MGFFSSIFGTDSGSTTEQTQNSTTSANQTQSQKGNTTQSGSTTQSTLDPETLAMLKSILPGLVSDVGGATADAGAIRGIVSKLAGGSNQDLVNAQISSSQAEAKRQFGIGEGAQIAGLEQQIGSKGNSFSQLLEQKGNTDLVTSLTAISDQARLDASKQSSADLGAAIAGSSAAAAADQAPLQQFLATIQALTGAQTTQATSGTQVSDVSGQATGVSNTSTVGKTKGSSSTTQGLFPSLLSWLKP